MALIGYARVSTHGQELDNQLVTLDAAGCVKVFAEKITGKYANRPELTRLFDYVRTNDVVTVTRLDRLARNTRDLLEICERFSGLNVGLKSLAEPWADTTSPAGKMVLTVMAGVAEFERSLIVARTTEGRMAAKRRGIKFGRKNKLTNEQVKMARIAIGGGQTVKSVAVALGVHYTTLYRLLSSGA